MGTLKITGKKARKAPGNGTISRFIDRNFRHFNSLALKNAAAAYREHMDSGGKMFLAMAGAMSTAELGLTLAEMIRRDKIHGIACTGANLEEDVFNLVANKDYVMVPHYRDLTPADERRLLKRNLNRVTDTCIPGDVMRKVEGILTTRWKRALERGERKFPHEFLYEVLLAGDLERHYQIDPADSWLLAAAEKNLPLFVPGWEDSTLGNVYTAQCIRGNLAPSTIRTGIEYMMELTSWYERTAAACRAGVGFFQIGGGIAGDFPICAVPLLIFDLKKKVKLWSYFCQISDSVTSYGSYSGAVPNEKITWNKLDVDSPKFVIESDATIVAPLVFSYVLND
ncbi:MAG TPA: deoxyhypusine synthase family protein [Elusimicrobiales bacterium]|nr:deoxyhypusine synthase family protein [Elusimicrobiales bacterium]